MYMQSNKQIKILQLPALPDPVIDVRMQDGKKTGNEYRIDPIKTGCIISVISLLFFAGAKLSYFIIILILIALGSAAFVFTYLLAIDLSYLFRIKTINGKPFKPWLNSTHDIVYEIEIKVSKWERYYICDNVINYHRPKLTEYNGHIKGLIHVPWANYSSENAVPAALVRDKDDLKRGFEELKLRYSEPNITGRILHMRYAGQREKELRFC